MGEVNLYGPVDLDGSVQLPDAVLVAEAFRPFEVEVDPGVFAVIGEEAGSLVVFWVRADPPGTGAVARWLDAMPTARRVKVIAVSSPRLAGMLERRGFRSRLVASPYADDWVPAHVRRAAAGRCLEEVP